MKMLGIVRDAILIVAALAVAIWYAWAAIELGYLQKLRLAQQVAELQQKVQTMEKAARPAEAPKAQP